MTIALSHFTTLVGGILPWFCAWFGVDSQLSVSILTSCRLLLVNANPCSLVAVNNSALCLFCPFQLLTCSQAYLISWYLVSIDSSPFLLLLIIFTVVTGHSRSVYVLFRVPYLKKQTEPSCIILLSFCISIKIRVLRNGCGYQVQIDIKC